MCLQNYEILCGDILTAVWEGKKLTVLNQKFLPQFLRRVHNADKWLESRAVDSHRPHSRLLKKALRMKERDDVATVLQVNGVSITDNYWVRPVGSSLRYEDVALDDKYYRKTTSKAMANLALSGSSRSFNYISERTASNSAELTNIGSFEKCWKNIDGEWWMFKQASRNEAFSEVFIFRLCKLLGISCAEYEPADNGTVKSKDFTGSTVNFEPALSFLGEDEDYESVIAQLEFICPSAVPDYIRMIFLDALVFNPDRHTANFGLIRSRETGEYLSFAPCFDHNMALISRGYPQSKTRKDLLISLFCDIIKTHSNYRKYIPVVTREKLEEAMIHTGMKVRQETVINFILERYQIIVAECE